MSEEILRALAILYGIIAKQDGGTTVKEREFAEKSFRNKINREAVPDYIAIFDTQSEFGQDRSGGKEKLTSVKDSVKTLAVCRKINKTLTRKQKIVALVELLEMLNEDGNSPRRREIIDTVAKAFTIDPKVYDDLSALTLSTNLEDLKKRGFLSLGKKTEEVETKSPLVFHHLRDVDMIFVKTMEDGFQLNGSSLSWFDTTLFPRGSVLKSKKGHTWFYSDIASRFQQNLSKTSLSFKARNIGFKFPNGVIGLRDIDISEGPGKLIAIMGASGAGKTTLLNVLAGLESPSVGEVVINGINLHKGEGKLRGVVGYVPQDDLLIEDLSVFQNLYYSARLYFRDESKRQIAEKALRTLDQLGLSKVKSLKVGNALSKSVSGGQRKRLNIALELIREPSVMFLDEPTSGLSSKDSEKVIDLLKELTLKGTLIFVVIHQPSSDIYKMFDKVFILDTGGYPIFYGHPVEAINYFKKASGHADHEKGQCPECGNVNPEQLFNIIEEKVVDEFGNYTEKRKINTEEWTRLFRENRRQEEIKDLKGFVSTSRFPSGFSQFKIFTIRDFISKIANSQYLLINLLEAPALALILTFIIRYKNADDGYVYRFNENIPAYLLMSVVVAIFMGLSISAEELIRDRKILKRERLLDLSRLGYLGSKITILFTFSAIQTLTFVLVGNTILEIKGMYLSYWLILFTCACSANVAGLILSSALNSAVTVYILIPLLIIPQLILSGAMFSFEKINTVFRNPAATPLIADLTLSRWGFEALATWQFMENDYEKQVYPFEKIEALSNFSLIDVLPDLNKKIESLSAEEFQEQNAREEIKKLITNELNKRAFLTEDLPLKPEELAIEKNPELKYRLLERIEKLKERYNELLVSATKAKEKTIYNKMNDSSFNALKNQYHNKSLSDFVKNAQGTGRIWEVEGGYEPGLDWIYFNPEKKVNPLNYRTRFCAPTKNLGFISIPTYLYNIIVIWILTATLFATLYYDAVNWIIDWL